MSSSKDRNRSRPGEEHTTVKAEAERLREREAQQREHPDLVAGRGHETGDRTLYADDDASVQRTRPRDDEASHPNVPESWPDREAGGGDRSR